MSVLKYFKNTPGRPPIGRQVLSEFFFQIRNKVPGNNKKKPVARWGGATGPLFFFQGPRCKFKEKNYT